MSAIRIKNFSKDVQDMYGVKIESAINEFLRKDNIDFVKFERLLNGIVSVVYRENSSDGNIPDTDIKPRMVKKLRTVTGLGLVECKNILMSTNWNYEKALCWCRNKYHQSFPEPACINCIYLYACMNVNTVIRNCVDRVAISIKN